MVMKTIQQFAHNVKWDELDLLLIDLPLTGTGDAQLSLAQILPLDGVVVANDSTKSCNGCSQKRSSNVQRKSRSAYSWRSRKYEFSNG